MQFAGQDMADGSGWHDGLIAHVPEGVCVGRVHIPPSECPRGIGGPTPVVYRGDAVLDLSPHAGTIAGFLDRPDALEIAKMGRLRHLGAFDEILAASHHDQRRSDEVHLLAPIDLQVVKACGVTFATSLVERFIEEAAGGRPEQLGRARERLLAATGGRLDGLQAGTPEALALLDELRAVGIASPYLEVGLGPYAEIFTKAPVLAAVGWGQQVGVRSDSMWNNPEPEVVLVVDQRGGIVGATLGNDVNLRDIEGRSPLLLGIAKDANASCSIGPWIRLFDGDFNLDGLMTTDVALQIDGADGYRTFGLSRLSQISRDPRDLVAQAGGRWHDYPDGLVLFLGTMLVPTDDRIRPGGGFTHLPGDRVVVSSPMLGSLVNWVTTSDEAPPWRLGVGWLMDNLARRGLTGHRTDS
jgi:fumarylacetoacetate (FAA) hydrolase family protein